MKNAFLRINGRKTGLIKKKYTKYWYYNNFNTSSYIWAYTCRNFGVSSRAPVVECEHNSFITLRLLSVNQLTVRKMIFQAIIYYLVKKNFIDLKTILHFYTQLFF